MVYLFKSSRARLNVWVNSLEGYRQRKIVMSRCHNLHEMGWSHPKLHGSLIWVLHIGTSKHTWNTMSSCRDDHKMTDRGVSFGRVHDPLFLNYLRINIQVV